MRLRRMLATNEDLKRKIEAMEANYDHQFQIVFEAITACFKTPIVAFLCQ